MRHRASRAAPAAEWSLSDEGRESCSVLCERLREYGLQRIVTSTERKAVETGALVGARLNVTAQSAQGLHEHERRSTPQCPSRDSFADVVIQALQCLDELVLGEETADAAHLRFASAVGAVVQRHSAERIGVVAHGTVIALFVARANRLDPLRCGAGSACRPL